MVTFPKRYCANAIFIIGHVWPFSKGTLCALANEIVCMIYYLLFSSLPVDSEKLSIFRFICNSQYENICMGTDMRPFIVADYASTMKVKSVFHFCLFIQVAILVEIRHGGQLIKRPNGWFITGRGCGTNTPFKFLGKIPSNLSGHECTHINIPLVSWELHGIPYFLVF